MVSPLLGGPFCEQDGSWMTFTSTGSSMLVKLVTNDAGTSTGFQATWSQGEGEADHWLIVFTYVGELTTFEMVSP